MGPSRIPIPLVKTCHRMELRHKVAETKSLEIFILRVSHGNILSVGMFGIIAGKEEEFCCKSTFELSLAQ
jgi:hypothetical protein